MWAAQRDDYPITVKSGHSIAELVLSPTEIDYTAVDRPDAMILLSADGVAKVGHRLAAMDATGVVFAVPEVADVKTKAAVHVIDPKNAPVKLGARRPVALLCRHGVAPPRHLSPQERSKRPPRRHTGERAQKMGETIRMALAQSTG